MASPTEQPVRFDHVTVAYQQSIAIEDVSFELSPGEFLGIIGPNGSGKTTLLRAVLGLVRPVSGNVVVLGAAGRELPNVRRHIGYVPQRRALDPQFPISVRDAVAMGLYPTLGAFRRPTAGEQARVEQALAAVGLSESTGHVAGHLSGGQQQRLLIARALVQEPQILLLDEPTSAVDVATRSAIVELVRRLHAERRLTTLYVTHDVNEVLPCVDKVLYINRTVRAFGSCAQVLSRETLEALYGGRVIFAEEGGRQYVVVGDHHA
ncbi:metal ABC transporter ATP-binding protein [candidate division WOR-3 bacterium]|nr:metal ABC transporter ATP-binding protein [candidate division WOR-3 bacterium]